MRDFNLEALEPPSVINCEETRASTQTSFHRYSRCVVDGMWQYKR